MKMSGVLGHDLLCPYSCSRSVRTGIVAHREEAAIRFAASRRDVDDEDRTVSGLTVNAYMSPTRMSSWGGTITT